MIEGWVYTRDLDLYFCWIHIEFFGEDHRQTTVDALSHFALADDDRHRVIRANSNKGMGLKVGGWSADIGSADQPRAQSQTSGRTAGNDADADQKLASPVVGCAVTRFAHADLPPRLISAARLMAARMRG